MIARAATAPPGPWAPEGLSRPSSFVIVVIFVVSIVGGGPVNPGEKRE